MDFLLGTGLDIDRGLLVNEYLQTNLPDIYAAGDCAQVYNPALRNYWVSIGWPNAEKLGEVAAQPAGPGAGGRPGARPRAGIRRDRGQHLLVEAAVRSKRRPVAGDLVVCFCGRAGDGARAAGRVLARAAAGLGLHARHVAVYPAEIRGAGKTLAYTAITREPLRGPASGWTCSWR